MYKIHATCSGDDVPPPLLPHYRRLVGEAERDVPLVVLMHLQEYQHEAHKLDEVARQADGERRGGEPHFGGICQGDEVLPVLEEVQGLPDLGPPDVIGDVSRRAQQGH